MTFRPMLAASKTITKVEVDFLPYPKLASPKLDGIRCIITEAGPVTRSLKPIKNKYVRKKLECLPIGLDGELIVGPMTGPNVFKRTQSGVMSIEGEPDFIFHVFDDFKHDGTFEERLRSARDAVSWVPRSACPVYYLPHERIWTPEHLHKLEERCVNQGYEGVMLRDPNGPYKFGRATRKEGTLLKYKRFHDAEARVKGAIELMRNENEATTNALGLTERSSAKDGKVGAGMLGALECEWNVPDPDHALYGQPVSFKLGSGFTEEDRVRLWKEWLATGQVGWGDPVIFKYQEITEDGKPRFEVWKGFRSTEDL